MDIAAIFYPRLRHEALNRFLEIVDAIAHFVYPSDDRIGHLTEPPLLHKA
jgi:hypothetical protein